MNPQWLVSPAKEGWAASMDANNPHHCNAGFAEVMAGSRRSPKCLTELIESPCSALPLFIASAFLAQRFSVTNDLIALFGRKFGDLIAMVIDCAEILSRLCLGCPDGRGVVVVTRVLVRARVAVTRNPIGIAAHSSVIGVTKSTQLSTSCQGRHHG